MPRGKHGAAAVAQHLLQKPRCKASAGGEAFGRDHAPQSQPAPAPGHHERVAGDAVTTTPGQDGSWPGSGRPQAGWRGAGIARRSYSRGLTAAPQRVGASARKPSGSQEPRGGLKPPCIDCAGRQEGAERERQSWGRGRLHRQGQGRARGEGEPSFFGEPQSEPAELNRRTGAGRASATVPTPASSRSSAEAPRVPPASPHFLGFVKAPDALFPPPRFQSN